MTWMIIAAALVPAAIGLAILRHVRRQQSHGRAPIIDEAVARVKNGEVGVRIEAGQWGGEARAASLFNAVVSEIETGLSDPELARSRTNSGMYAALRGELVAGMTPDEKPLTFVAIVEIERFAALRQSIGYSLANQLIAKLATRIGQQIAHAEIGRVGRVTIEFAFPARSAADAETQLTGAIAALERRISIDGYNFDLSVTIGFADAGTTSIRDELVDQAAAALTAAQADRRKVRFADATILSQKSFADLELMRALPLAMLNGELDLHYQPKLEARTNRISSVEALLRWTNPTLGRVPTDRFIAVAEETGAIRELTEWVLKRAVADQQRLIDAGHVIEIYVNLSGLLLPDGDFARTALELVSGAPGRIGFEITETAVITDPTAAIANLQAFSEAGIRIAIDDYGSGLSSLAYLKQLPAHELKIDRMFVSGLTESHRDPLLVRSSIDLAHALEMEVTAEGVDDPVALSLLRVMGCDLLQGYLISPPIPLGELVTFLEDTAQLVRLSAPAPSVADWPKSDVA